MYQKHPLDLIEAVNQIGRLKSENKSLREQIKFLNDSLENKGELSVEAELVNFIYWLRRNNHLLEEAPASYILSDYLTR